MRPNAFTLIAAGAGVATLAGPAPAFYFAGWPADGLPRTPSLIKPGTEIVVPAPRGLQIDNIPAADPDPAGGATDDPPTPGHTPPDVPEPATLALAAAGLAAVAGRKLARR